MRATMLLDGERVAAGLHLLERDVKVKSVFGILVCDGLEGYVHVFFLGIRQRDVLDTGGAVTFEGEVVVLPGEQLSVADNLPVFAIDLLDGERGTFEVVKS